MIFNYGIVRRMASTNPVQAVKIPAGLPKGRRDIPTDDQLQKVRDGLNIDFGLFAYMLLYTGLRRGELRGCDGRTWTGKARSYTFGVPCTSRETLRR